MRLFATWLGLSAAVFAALAVGLHFYRSETPRRVLVAIDSSFEMADAWDRMPRLLDMLDDGRYETYALRSEKSEIHGWAAQLDLGRARPYGARDLSALEAAAEAADADRLILVTNAARAELRGLGDWDVVRP